jgi:hypothetical protein
LLVVLTTLLLGSLARGDETVFSRLSDRSPTWNRIKDNGAVTGRNCDGTAPDSFNDGVPYKTYRLSAVRPVILEVEVTSETPSRFDPFLALYCRPFDPKDPTANLVAADDDGAGYPNAGFSADDEIVLQPGVPYELVVTSYSTFSLFGEFRLILAGTAVRVLEGTSLPGLLFLLGD